MSEQEILQTIARFADTAACAEQAGFDGVQIHAAHGYLISQFLSPLTNRRQDRWGGDIEGRARFLVDVIKAVRAAVSPEFVISVKINSADFQRGGFDEEDLVAVMAYLNELKVDLVEFSGGTYESPTLFNGESKDQRTLAREAYFLAFAQKIVPMAKMPLMTTGGIRRFAVAEQVLQSGIAMVGMASALALNPDLPRLWQAGNYQEGEKVQTKLKDKSMNALATLIVIQRHIKRLATGKRAGKALNTLVSLLLYQWHNRKQVKRYKRWLKQGY